MTNANTINLLLPEIALVVAATVIFVAGAFFDARGGWRWIACCALAAAGAALSWQGGVFEALRAGPRAAEAFGPVSSDAFGYLTCWFALGLGLLLLLVADLPGRVGPSSEWAASLLLVVAGMMLSVHANDLVLIFMALELISIPTYVLLVLSRPDVAGREATLKYFFLSVVSSGLLLYGFSFLYGATGSTELARLAAVGSTGGGATLVHLGLLLSLAGLGLKIALVPFHFYAPDVYQGTSPAAAALLATVPKVAGIAVLLRLGAAAGLDPGALSWQLLVCLAILTMTVGNVMALWQRNVRRLLAYSSIAHAGYLLIGLSVWAAVRSRSGLPAGHAAELAVQSVSATLFYLAGYAVATVGAFAAVGYLSRRDRQVDRVSDLDGAAGLHPAAAAALSICMLSLTGLPPLVGFWGKLFLILRALSVKESAGVSGSLRAWFIALAVATVVNAAISAAYYLRLVGAMYFRPSRDDAASRSPAVADSRPAAGAALAMGICAMLVLATGINPAPLMRYADAAAKSAVTPLSPPAPPDRMATTATEPGHR